MERRQHFASVLIPVELFTLFALTPGIVYSQAGNDAGTPGGSIQIPYAWIPWVIVAAIGAAAGTTEIIAKYRDEPSRALVTQPAILYILINAAASLIALFLIRELHFTFAVAEDQVALAQVLVAGFGAMIVIRAAVFTIRAPGKETMVGPVNVLQTILDACDRAVDRTRAESRATEVSKLMEGISFDRAIVELPVVSLALMQNLSSEEQTLLRARVDDLRSSELSNEGKCLSLGLVLLRSLGVDALRAAITTVQARIKLNGNLAPIIDFMYPATISAEVIGEGVDIPLTLAGQNFDSTAKVLLNGQVLTTVFDPLTNQLHVTLPVATLQERAEHEVTVFTRANDGGESAPKLLRMGDLNPTPQLDTIDPSSISTETVALGGEIELTVNGLHFVPDAKVRIDGQDQPTDFANDQKVIAHVASAVLTTPGDHWVTVFNPAPLGGESAPGRLTVATPGELHVDAPPDPTPVPDPTPPGQGSETDNGNVANAAEAVIAVGAAEAKVEGIATEWRTPNRYSGAAAPDPRLRHARSD